MDVQTMNSFGSGQAKMTKEERNRQQHLERLKYLRPIDDIFMRGMFKDNIPFAEFVLRILMRKDDLKLIQCTTQADMKQVTGARSICLDAYGVDSTGKRYDIEIQRADKGAGAHRARYHSSVMDVENLKEGQDFDNLPEAYIIFITEKDFYKVGKPFYEIERVNLTMGELFNDGSHILYVNGEYRGDDAIGKLMHDFNCHRAKDMLCPEMASRTRALKDTQKGRDSMCKAMEDALNLERDRTTARDVINLMDSLSITVDQAIAALKIPESDRDRIKTLVEEGLERGYV